MTTGNKIWYYWNQRDITTGTQSFANRIVWTRLTLTTKICYSSNLPMLNMHAPTTRIAEVCLNYQKHWIWDIGIDKFWLFHLKQRWPCSSCEKVQVALPWSVHMIFFFNDQIIGYLDYKNDVWVCRSIWDKMIKFWTNITTLKSHCQNNKKIDVMKADIMTLVLSLPSKRTKSIEITIDI